ncbi:MAG: AAA family ATPase [Thermoflexales bacterium]|nr:AAA family ATPase [Thermoflexales bacterium]
MKQLTRIRLINWHLFENTTVTCSGTTYLIGINGAGKSTILDAVQFALVGAQREVRFNQAALAGGKRTLASYVRGELGTEGQRYLRDDATGVVALEFRNADGSYFVHGAVIDAYADGRSPDVMYFIVNAASLNDAWFFQSGGQLFDSRAFKRHMDHFALPPAARAQTFGRLEDYRFHLLNRLGQLKDTFPAKIVKGLAFTPLINIREFVHNYLLDENLVDVKTLQDQLETLRHFEALAANVRERIEALGRIEELDQERVANRRRRLTNGYIQRRAQGDAQAAQLKRSRLELDETRLELGRAGLRRDIMDEELKRARQAQLDAQVALQADATAVRERELRDKLDALEPLVKALRDREARVAGTLAREIGDARALRQCLVEDGLPVPPALDEFIHTPTPSPVTTVTEGRGWGEAFLPSPPIRSANDGRGDGGEGLSRLQAELESLGQSYAGQSALLNEQARRLREEAEQVQREISQLRTGDRETSYEAEAPEAVRLRRLLRAELGLGADELPFLCTVLDVPDESWQDAVEGVLGRNRFCLLVPPQHYDAAMQLYHQRRHKDKLHGVGLPDIERILSHSDLTGCGRPASDRKLSGLANEVHTPHEGARAFVDLLLGNVVKCDTLEELRQHRTAVTRDGFLRRSYTTAHMNPHVYRHWFVGSRAVPRQIEQREARLEEIRVELLARQDKALALHRRLALTRDKARVYFDLERDLAELSALPTQAAQLELLRDELARLDVRCVEALRGQVEACRGQAEQLQADLSQLDKHIGGLEMRAATLAEQTIPALEREADGAAQSALEFLRAEQAEDALDEANKEYERRRERQPLDVVLQNAVRYEGDHQTAETRSRDRLREAKQAYSLRYDFGYDEDEDAARYLGERDRYVQSELPQYEERIAAQAAQAEQELVENFIHRLREQIQDARQQLGYLNTTLAGLRFGGERFEFITHPESTLRPVYDMVMDSQNILGETLLESDFRQRHQQGWDLLFQRLTAGQAEEAAVELHQLQDYRNYLQYDIRIHYPSGDHALLSQISTKKSGGETTTPFYVAMAASFAQAYRLNQPRASDTVRLALFDEAFSKMDGSRTASALKFMVDTQLQVLLATPPDKAAGLLPYVDSVRTVVRKNNHSFVIEIDKAEVMRELEARQ